MIRLYETNLDLVMSNSVFTNEELKRYRGHISLCELDLVGQMSLKNSHVLIVGAGGLGSPVAMYLASAGVGNIGIIDADKVSIGNLQRQILHGTPDIGIPKVVSAKKTLQRINPDITVTTYEAFFSDQNAKQILAEYDLVIDCTDNFETRLLISDMCVDAEKPFIFGGVMRFKGQLFTHIPGSADFRTIFGEEMPELNEPCEISGILNSVVGVIGSLQATEAIKYLTKTGDLLTNRLLVFDAITMQFDILEIGNGI